MELGISHDRQLTRGIMFSARHSIRCLIGLIMLVTSFFCIPIVSYACSPAPPDPWFTEQIAVTSANLPSGVNIRVIAITRYGLTREYIEITNSSSTPLYIIGTPWTGGNTFAPLALALPPGVGPTHKVLNQRAFTWRPVFDTPQSKARMDWEQGTIERPDAVLLSIGHNTLMSDQGNVVELAPRNKTGDNRPADAQLPTPQTVRVPLVYGAQMLHVPTTVSYILNPAYEQDSVARSLKACSTAGFFVPGFCFVSLVIGGCIGFGWLIYRWWTTRNAKRLII